VGLVARIGSMIPFDIQYFADYWRPLPYWCRFFIEVGLWVAAYSKHYRLRLAISVPSRDYAVSFISLGLVYGANSGHKDYSRYFEMLCKLEPGTPLVFIDNDRKKKAIFVGTAKHPVTNEIALRIQLESRRSGGLTYYIRKKDAHRIILTEGQAITLPANQKGYCLNANLDLIGLLFSTEKPVSFLTSSSYDCLIAGTIGSIREEITETVLRFDLKGHCKEGYIADIIRPRRMVGDLGYRSDIISPLNDTGIDSGDTLAVLLDGAKAFFERRVSYERYSMVVVLDRTESKYFDAVTDINEQFVLNNRKDPNLLPQFRLKVPPGIYVSISGERRFSIAQALQNG
jgi:hypothetical protein